MLSRPRKHMTPNRRQLSASFLMPDRLVIPFVLHFSSVPWFLYSIYHFFFHPKCTYIPRFSCRVYLKLCIMFCGMYILLFDDFPLMTRPQFRWFNAFYTTGAVWSWRYAQERNSQECNIWAIDVCFAQEPTSLLRKRRCDASIRVLRPYIWNFRYDYSDIDILCLDIVSLLVCTFGY